MLVSMLNMIYARVCSYAQRTYGVHDWTTKTSRAAWCPSSQYSLQGWSEEGVVDELDCKGTCREDGGSYPCMIEVDP